MAVKLSNRYKLITNVRSSLMAVNIHITIIELNALHTKRQNLFQELDAVIHLLMEAKHWGLRKSRNATSLRSEERFSRNAETDLVCRLLLEKKKLAILTRIPLNFWGQFLFLFRKTAWLTPAKGPMCDLRRVGCIQTFLTKRWDLCPSAFRIP